MKHLNISDEILVALRQITRAIDLHSKQLVQKYGLTGPQMLLLKEISRTKRIASGVLSRHASLSQATVTSILDRLEKSGYVKRIRSDEDKRVVFVEPTEKTNKIFENAPPLLQETFTEQLQQLTPWEKTLILSTLQRVAGMMEAQALNVAPFLSGEELVQIQDAPASTDKKKKK
jgi:DNA-binding MarR family transcriptional regulator